MGVLRRRDHLAILTTRHIAFALVAIAGCAEAPFGEGDPPDEECNGDRAVGPANGANLEIGRLQGSTFVPFVGGETLELEVSGDPYGWAFRAAVRFPVESTPAMRTGCVSFAPFEVSGGGNFGIAVVSPGHPAQFVTDPTTPSIGHWESVGEARILIGTDLLALLAAPKSFFVAAQAQITIARTPDIMLRFTNNEGFLAD